METRKCKHCNAIIGSDKRADSKFCSNSCKANYWEANKHKKKTPDVKNTLGAIAEKEKPNNNPLEGLRGVIDNTPKTDVKDVKQTSVHPSNPNENNVYTSKIVQQETQAYKDAFSKKEKLEEELNRTEEALKKGKLTLQAWQEEYRDLERLNKRNPYKPNNVDIMALEEYEGDSEAIFRSQRMEQINGEFNALSEKIKKVESILPNLKKNFEEALLQLKKTHQFETIQTQGSENSPLSIFKASFLKKMEVKNSPAENKDAPSAIEIHQNDNEAENQNQKETPNIQSNSKLISSRQLREIDYKCLNFQGKWKDFFGLPAVVFHLAVHGKPGEGKSTFCIQFADYLAKNFGRVVYISGEEGFSKTLQDKVVNNKIDNLYLFFADIRSYEQIKNEIPNNQFHFIFIDSLDTLKIDALRLKELREFYPHSAFITISQSTKDGKMRGSQEIIHDTDIAAKVEDGIAITTKNRYHPRGTEFQVFPDSSPKPLKEPRNIL